MKAETMSQSKGRTPKPNSSVQADKDAMQALSQKLEAARERQAPKPFDEGNSGMAVGFKYATEFSAAVLVGAALGYGADNFLGTAPWGLLVGLILGFAAGVMNVIRAAKDGMTGDLGEDLVEMEADE